ncbi:hypothetical protein MKW94_025144, partial [Papaver nudicaule]|nr:hypothetical protein [Papaver nudicaule]
MPSFLSVNRHPGVFFFGLLMVVYSFVADVAARRLLASSAATTSVNSTKMAKEGCTDRCGNIIIPYPFGMGTSNCYRDSYKITCETSYRTRAPVAFLNPLLYGDRYEVSKIGLDYIKIHMVAPLTCNVTKFSDVTYDVPYPVSTTRNKLTVLGCNVYGYVTSRTDLVESSDSSDDQTSLSSKGKGCESSCDMYTRYPTSGSSGYGYCKTDIPEGLTSYSIQTKGMVSNSTNSSSYHNITKNTGLSVDPCVSAFLIDHEYSGVQDLLQLATNDSSVPVILNWAINDVATCEEAQRNPGSYACGRNSYCLESQNGPGYHCKCSKGYEGNPYLQDGCQDVDECKETLKCGKEVICTNMPGSYNCSCPPDKTLETHGLGSYCAPDKQYQKNKQRLHRIVVIASS